MVVGPGERERGERERGREGREGYNLQIEKPEDADNSSISSDRRQGPCIASSIHQVLHINTNCSTDLVII